jgi:hypothetical protein
MGLIIQFGKIETAQGNKARLDFLEIKGDEYTKCCF